MSRTDDIADIEIKLLLQGIFDVYGYDFREYSEASLRRRLTQWLSVSGYRNFSHAQADILRDRNLLDSFVAGITVNVSDMFRDPAFFRSVREHILPHLRTYPFIRIWHAGCSNGEEAYSMSILLHEEGLAGHFRIYATDINEKVLENAKKGIFPLQSMQRFTKNYQSAGGKTSFSDYYSARYGYAILNSSIGEHIVFANHNLAVDSDFGEMHMILCRNVLIYFRPALKERVLGLFDSCLLPGGFLCLGLKETLEGRQLAGRYEEMLPRMRIYRKLYA